LRVVFDLVKLVVLIKEKVDVLNFAILLALGVHQVGY
jgi:hypothetical protein